MIYTNEQTQDKKIAEAVFKKYFLGNKSLKDDMIQVALIRLWEFRANKRSYYTNNGAWKTAKNAMLDFLKSQERFADDISIFTEVNDGDDENIQLIDTLSADDYNDSIEYKRYMTVLETIHEYTNTLDTKTRQIISMYMNRRSFDEIAHYVNLSKSTVHKCVKAFRRVMAFRLGLNIEGLE